jgi:hypothetical protein
VHSPSCESVGHNTQGGRIPWLTDPGLSGTMSKQNNSGDDGSRHDGSRTDNVDVSSRQRPEELNHIHDAFEGIGQIVDGLMREDHELRAFVEQQDGNVDSIPERGAEQQGGNADIHPEVDDDHQDSNVDSLPSEDHTATAVLEPDPWQLEAEALRKRVQAVIAYFLRRMNYNNAEVSEMLEQGMKGGIVPRPKDSIGDEGAHLERMKKRRPSGMKYNKENSDEAEEARKPVICF